MLAGIRARRELAFHGRLDQHGRILAHGLHGAVQGTQGVGQLTGFVLAVQVELGAEVASSHLLRGVDQLADGLGQAARDGQTGEYAEQRGSGCQRQHQVAGAVGRGHRLFTLLLRQFGLYVDQTLHGGKIGVELFAACAQHLGGRFVNLVCLDQVYGLVLRAQVDLTLRLDQGQLFLGLGVGDQLFQLFEAIGHDLPRRPYAIQLTLGIGFVLELGVHHGVSQGTGDHVDVVDHFLRPDHLGQLVGREVFDLRADCRHAKHAQA